MERVNFDQLWSLGIDWDESSIEKSFSWCLQRLSEYMGLSPILRNVSVKLLEGKFPEDIVHENIFSCWVSRGISTKNLTLKVYKECGAFLPFVLLRELYACFLPEAVKRYNSVQLVIFYVVLEDGRFGKKEIDSWREFVDSKRKHRDNLEDQEHINQYFKNQVHHRNVMTTFFSYLKRNESIINPSKHDFASVLFQPYEDYTEQFLLQPDNIEALRLTGQIYSTVKKFTSAKDYENLFDQFVSNGSIVTSLTKNVYSMFLKDLKNTVLAPTYGFTWSYFGAVVYYGYVKFHPLLKKNSIVKALSEVEFIYLTRRNYSSLSHNTMIFAFFPQIYENDFLNFFDRLKKIGYVVDYSLYKVQEEFIIVNLNVYKNFYSNDGLIDPQHPEYDQKLFIEKHRLVAPGIPSSVPFSVTDFLITDLARMFSVEGIGYEERKNQLQMYKDELRRYRQKIRSLNANLKNHFKEVIEDQEVKEFFVSFVNLHKVHGFFYVSKLLQSLNVIANALEKRDRATNGNINKTQLEGALISGTAFRQLEVNLLLTNQTIKNHVKEELLPLYYQKREEFEIVVSRYYKSSELLSSCANLQIYDLKRILRIVNNSDIAKTIFDARERKQFDYYDKLKEENITINLLEDKLSDLLDKNVATPTIINTLSYNWHSTIHLVARYSEATMKYQAELSSYFSSIYFTTLYNAKNNQRAISIELRTGYLTPKERYSLISIIFNALKSDILRMHFVKGAKYTPFMTLRRYYDFPQGKYFYARDMFHNLFLSAKKEFGKPRTINAEKTTSLWSHLLSKDDSMKTLNEKIQKRINATLPYSVATLKKLKDFACNIEQNFAQPDSFSQIKNNPFFKNHVKAIKFLPIFSRFGLAQYHLYFYPSNADKINFKLLLNNSFQSLKCSVGVDVAPSFLIKYVYPYKFPNMRYINRATKTLRIVREYCVFQLVQSYFNFYTNNSFSSERRKINPNEFGIHVQNVVFNDKWEKPLEHLKECNLEVVTTTPHGPDSEEFSNLRRIYSRKPVDLKKSLFFKSNSKLKDFSTLFSKKLVRPYVKFKNLGFHEKIRFILPNISNNVAEKLLRIFSFFNYCEAYKIKGSLYVQGLEDEIEFDNGLYVKLRLSYHTGSIENSDVIGALLTTLEESFEVLGINHYIVLDNMIKPESFLDHVFGNDNDLNGYNPLLNLKWDKKNKLYRNHKLYDEKNKPVYPSLLAMKNIIPKK